MNCKECGNDFQPGSGRGHAQVYCSHICRQKAGMKRHKERIINGIMNEQKAGQNDPILPFGEPSRGVGEVQRRMVSAPLGEWVSTPDYISILERLYDAKTEAATAKIEADNLRRELSLKSAELEALEAELEDDDESSKSDGIIGQIQQVFPTLVSSYKQEPEATMGFLRASISEITGSLIGKNGGKAKG